MRVKTLILMCSIWYEECLVAWIPHPPPNLSRRFTIPNAQIIPCFVWRLLIKEGFTEGDCYFPDSPYNLQRRLLASVFFFLLRHVCFVPHLFLVPMHDVCLPPWPSETWPVTLILLHNPIPPWAFQCVAGKIPDAAHNLFQSYGLMIWRGLGGMQ